MSKYSDAIKWFSNSCEPPCSEDCEQCKMEAIALSALREAEQREKGNMTLVYIAHPFGNKQENVDDAGRIIKLMLRKYPDTTYYSPLHATGFFYDALPYDEGMRHCFEAVSRCDEVWFCPNWETSRGCKLEMDYATRKGMTVRFIDSNGDIL